MIYRLILGCHGRMSFGINMCPGTENVIYTMESPDKDDAILNYLEKHSKLALGPATDPNKVVNIIQYLISLKQIKSHLEEPLYKYLQMHKNCGTYIYMEKEE